MYNKSIRASKQYKGSREGLCREHCSPDRTPVLSTRPIQLDLDQHQTVCYLFLRSIELAMDEDTKDVNDANMTAEVRSQEVWDGAGLSRHDVAFDLAE